MEKRAINDMHVILSDIWLDNEEAVMKLSGQLSEQMKDSYHIWAAPIYRRLLSTDKRERDASERCLLKIRSTFIPPSLDLSKLPKALCDIQYKEVNLYSSGMA